jgi:hypothetical protein
LHDCQTLPRLPCPPYPYLLSICSVSPTWRPIVANVETVA